MSDLNRLLELEKLVAEHLFGFTEISCVEANASVTFLGVREGIRQGLPYYAREIAAAWAVVERVRKDCAHSIAVDLRIGTYPDGAPCNEALVARTDGGWHEADAPTLPVAICLAALAWAGVEVEEVPSG